MNMKQTTFRVDWQLQESPPQYLLQTLPQTKKYNNNMTHINLAYYEKRDWRRFLASIDDREGMHGTWQEWHKAYLKTKKGLILHGLDVKDFVVDIDELKNYCKVRGIKNDGEACSQFVSNK